MPLSAAWVIARLVRIVAPATPQVGVLGQVRHLLAAANDVNCSAVPPQARWHVRRQVAEHTANSLGRYEECSVSAVSVRLHRNAAHDELL